MANSAGPNGNRLSTGRCRSFLRRLVILGLLATLRARFLDHLGQAAGEAARPDRRAAVGAGVADGFEHPRAVGPSLPLLARAAWPIFLWDAISLALGPAGADHDLVV